MIYCTFDERDSDDSIYLRQPFRASENIMYTWLCHEERWDLIAAVRRKFSLRSDKFTVILDRRRAGVTCSISPLACLTLFDPVSMLLYKYVINTLKRKSHVSCLGRDTARAARIVELARFFSFTPATSPFSGTPPIASFCMSTGCPPDSS